MVKKRTKKNQLVIQEHPMGCSVACVAALCNLDYQKALQLFDVPELAWQRGFYCSEIVKALKKVKLNYKFEELQFSKNPEKIDETGTIVFISPNSKYPAGHFLLRIKEGWMNPWSNFPLMIPLEGAIEESLPGEVSYLIYPAK